VGQGSSVTNDVKPSGKNERTTASTETAKKRTGKSAKKRAAGSYAEDLPDRSGGEVTQPRTSQQGRQ
jgi:hypothetical protein